MNISIFYELLWTFTNSFDLSTIIHAVFIYVVIYIVYFLQIPHTCDINFKYIKIQNEL